MLSYFRHFRRLGNQENVANSYEFLQSYLYIEICFSISGVRFEGGAAAFANIHFYTIHIVKQAYNKTLENSMTKLAK